MRVSININTGPAGKERSRGKDDLTFKTQFARLRDQSTTHFMRNTYCLSFFAVE